MTAFLISGNCTMDDVVTAAGHLERDQLGGNSVYAAAGLRLWRQPVRLLSIVGEGYPPTHLQQLAAHGIDVSAVAAISESHRLRTRFYYFPDGRRTERAEEARPLTTPRVAAELGDHTDYPAIGTPLHRAIWPRYSPLPEHLPPDLHTVAAAHLAPGPLPNNRDLAVALKQRSNGRILTTLDWPWWDWDDEASADPTLLAHVDYLLPSIEEATVYAAANGLDPFTALRNLLSASTASARPRAVVVKMGARGCRVLPAPGAAWVDIPAYPARVVDPTGAGDAFCGGFLAGIVQTGDPVAAAMHGAVSASFVIEGFGPLHALGAPLSAVRQRLHHLQQHVAHPQGSPPPTL